MHALLRELPSVAGVAPEELDAAALSWPAGDGHTDAVLAVPCAVVLMAAAERVTRDVHVAALQALVAADLAVAQWPAACDFAQLPTLLRAAAKASPDLAALAALPWYDALLPLHAYLTDGVFDWPPSEAVAHIFNGLLADPVLSGIGHLVPPEHAQSLMQILVSAQAVVAHHAGSAVVHCRVRWDAAEPYQNRHVLFPTEHLLATPLVGRDSELERLLQCCQQPNGCAVVFGAPGVGKSHLALHVAQRLRAQGARILRLPAVYEDQLVHDMAAIAR
mgnify:CR=1 FL=1